MPTRKFVCRFSWFAHIQIMETSKSWNSSANLDDATYTVRHISKLFHRGRTRTFGLIHSDGFPTPRFTVLKVICVATWEIATKSVKKIQPLPSLMGFKESLYYHLRKTETDRQEEYRTPSEVSSEWIVTSTLLAVSRTFSIVLSQAIRSPGVIGL